MPDDLNFLYRKYIINVLINFKHIWGGGGYVLIERGDLFNLAKKMVSVLHKELECKVGKVKYKKLGVM